MKNNNTCYVVRRPQGHNNFPIIGFFYYTGEKDNPWRCSSCATDKQHNSALRDKGVGTPPVHACCRKCGIDFYR